MSVFCGSCDDYYDIGCYDHCDSVNTLLPSTEAGDHIIRYQVRGVIHETETSVEGVGLNIVIPANFFNEDGEAYFSIVNPSGSDFTYPSGGVNYTCFKARMKITF